MAIIISMVIVAIFAYSGCIVISRKTMSNIITDIGLVVAINMLLSFYSMSCDTDTGMLISGGCGSYKKNIRKIQAWITTTGVPSSS